MPLINCDTDLILIKSTNCFFSRWHLGKSSANITVTDTKLYDTVVTLSTQDNAKVFEKLKSGFKRTIKWNK